MNESTIIALSGKKGSGKNTIASHINRHFCQMYKGVRNGVPFYKEFAFADKLKEFCIDILGLEHSQCYGTDEEKNTLTKYKWDDTPEGLVLVQTGAIGHGSSCRTGYMTGREVMQIFGTQSVRAWFGNVWADATIRYIQKTMPVVAIITDNRFPSEVEAVLRQSKGYIIRLTRNPTEGDTHASEVALDDFDWSRDRCFVLNNASLDITEQNEAIEPILDHIFAEYK